MTEAPTLPAPKSPRAKPLALTQGPRRVPGNTDGEQVARETDEEGEDEQAAIGARLGEEEAGDRGEQEHCDRDLASADPVGEHACGEALHRAVEDGNGRDPGELDVAEAQFLLDRHPEDTEHEPHGEHEGEGEGRHPQDAGCGPAAILGESGSGRVGAHESLHLDDWKSFLLSKARYTHSGHIPATEASLTSSEHEVRCSWLAALTRDAI